MNHEYVDSPSPDRAPILPFRTNPRKRGRQPGGISQAQAILMLVGHLGRPPGTLSVLGRAGCAWITLTPCERASIIKILAPTLTTPQVAETAGLSKRSITRNPSLRDLSAKLRKATEKPDQPRRFKSSPFWRIESPESALPDGSCPKGMLTDLLGIRFEWYEEYARFFDFFRDRKWPRQAVLLKRLVPELHDVEIAPIVGVDRSTLQKNEEYRSFRRLFHGSRAPCTSGAEFFDSLSIDDPERDDFDEPWTD